MPLPVRRPERPPAGLPVIEDQLQARMITAEFPTIEGFSVKSLTKSPTIFDMNGLGTIQARCIRAFIETLAHWLPVLLSRPVVSCPQRPQVRQGPAALKIIVLVRAKIKSADGPDVIDVPISVIFPGHTGFESSLYIFPEFSCCITDKLFPQARLVGLETLADPGPDIPTEPIFGPLVMPFLVLLNSESSQAGSAKRNGL